ncbi:GDSL esterase/lipase At4g10955 [Quercus suber]|uniref:GDSL esterase/lipase At4g10955 n=1 Tax=Quercus suber TaxID=58331 RepID=UPI000CE26DC5|nr:GDSL esterase/lipase At4g10955-like [Quercus suber]XP_023923680.1 GDSL esterase/lipase At4g10955-like [Quercus suber]
MPSKGQIVHHSEESEPSEPPRIEDFNWNNKCHVISAIACLVEAVYILSHEESSLALRWYDNLNFKFILVSWLIDENDKSIFGATFEYKGESLPNIPQFVIAFRGTILKGKTAKEDLKLDRLCLANRLHKSSRFQKAKNYIEHMVDLHGGERVWVAGHSLGAAIALLAGKEIAKKTTDTSKRIEAYLFNPPFCSDLIMRWFKNEFVKLGVQLAKNGLKLILSHFGEDHKDQEAQANDTLAFNALSNWVPHIFVHPNDIFCSAYIDYFQSRQKMLEIGFRKLEKVAAMKTMRMLLGMDSSSEAMHLLPSAILTINKVEFPRETEGFFDKFGRKGSAHELKQWWNPNSSYEFQDHIRKYNPPN